MYRTNLVGDITNARQVGLPQQIVFVEELRDE
jgi:hypothetical protein